MKLYLSCIGVAAFLLCAALSAQSGKLPDQDFKKLAQSHSNADEHQSDCRTSCWPTTGPCPSARCDTTPRIHAKRRRRCAHWQSSIRDWPRSTPPRNSQCLIKMCSHRARTRTEVRHHA